MDNKIYKGKVEWFNDEKGYGFITREIDNKPVFVHYSQIQQEGFKSLTAGETVEFETVETSKGIQAVSVYRVGGAV